MVRRAHNSCAPNNIDVKMPYFHRIDVKSNEQHPQYISVLTLIYIIETSQTCLIMVCSLLDVVHKEHNDKMERNPSSLSTRWSWEDIGVSFKKMTYILEER